MMNIKSDMRKNDKVFRVKGPNSAFLIFALVMMLMLSIAALLPLLPNDFWPYLRIGDEVLASGKIPTTEFMTFTRFGQSAVYLYWLPSVIFLKLYQWGGVPLVSLAALACIAYFYTLLWLCMRELKATALAAGIAMLLTTVIGINSWAIRPQLLTYPLFGFTLLALLRWQKGNHRLLWFVPLAAVLWANFHGSFIVLFFLLLPALLFGRGKKNILLIVTALSFAGTLVNHYGLGLWVNMFSMVNSASIKDFSLEWAPLTNDGWQANIFFFTLLIIPVLTALVKPKIPLLYWVWFLGFGWMALTAVRHEIWFLGVETFILVLLLSPILEKWTERSTAFNNRLINTTLGVVLLAFPLALLPGVRGAWWVHAPSVLSQTTPVEAADWLKLHPELEGEVWSDFSYSTYLTYALPQRKTFMTNRFEDFSLEQLEDNRAISNADATWEELLQSYDVRLIMLDVKNEPKLEDAASSSEAWQEVYRDERAIIFAKDTQ